MSPGRRPRPSRPPTTIRRPITAIPSPITISSFPIPVSMKLAPLEVSGRAARSIRGGRGLRKRRRLRATPSRSSSLGGELALYVVLGLIALLLLLGMFLAGAYNRLVALRNRFKNAFSQIDVQLKRRNDLIPNLVETVKGYMGHEKGTLEAVIQ